MRFKFEELILREPYKSIQEKLALAIPIGAMPIAGKLTKETINARGNPYVALNRLNALVQNCITDPLSSLAKSTLILITTDLDTLKKQDLSNTEWGKLIQAGVLKLSTIAKDLWIELKELADKKDELANDKLTELNTRITSLLKQISSEITGKLSHCLLDQYDSWVQLDRRFPSKRSEKYDSWSGTDFKETGFVLAAGPKGKPDAMPQVSSSPALSGLESPVRRPSLLHSKRHPSLVSANAADAIILNHPKKLRFNALQDQPDFLKFLLQAHPEKIVIMGSLGPLETDIGNYLLPFEDDKASLTVENIDSTENVARKKITYVDKSSDNFYQFEVLQLSMADNAIFDGLQAHQFLEFTGLIDQIKYQVFQDKFNSVEEMQEVLRGDLPEFKLNCRCLVHCHAGVGRTSMAVLAALFFADTALMRAFYSLKTDPTLMTPDKKAYETAIIARMVRHMNELRKVRPAAIHLEQVMAAFIFAGRTFKLICQKDQLAKLEARKVERSRTATPAFNRSESRLSRRVGDQLFLPAIPRSQSLPTTLSNDDEMEQIAILGSAYLPSMDQLRRM